MEAKLVRKTKETQIQLSLRLHGGPVKVSVPVPFLKHMLESFAKHSHAGLQVSAKSLDEDPHHLIEDVAITLGRAIAEASSKTAVRRFGHEVIPMDDALVACYLDLGGRAYYEGTLPDPLYEHFMRSLSHEAGLNCHLVVMRGREPHHVTEAAFKALARSLRQAWQPAERVESTKGEVDVRGG